MRRSIGHGQRAIEPSPRASVEARGQLGERHERRMAELAACLDAVVF